MPNLTQVLDSLLVHIARNRQRLDTLLPGLTHEQIEDIVAPLPFRLPNEVYQLYRWRNGTRGQGDLFESYVQLLPGCQFLPLEEAVAYFLEGQEVQDDYYDEAYGYDPHLFALLKGGRSSYSVQGAKEQTQTGLVVYDSGESEPRFVFGSVLGLFVALEACWRSGVYSIRATTEPTRYGRLHVEVDALQEEGLFSTYALLTSDRQFLRWPLEPLEQE